MPHRTKIRPSLAAEARCAYAARRPDLVPLDIWMPDTDGVTLLREWSHDHHVPIPVVMMSGHGTVETAVEAIRLGAYDFIEKPLTTAKLLVTVGRALEANRLQQENLSLRRRTEVVAQPVGKSKLMQRLRETIERIAAHDTWVLVTGEPGSGKEVAARYLHAMSARRERPFISVNCAALAEQLLEAELFGHVKGAFTGAIANKPGRFQLADGGTLFLDEIGDLSPSTLTSLLSKPEARRKGLCDRSWTRTTTSRSVSVTVAVALMKSSNRCRDLAVS